MANVLFVCTGNLCRSPMAAALLSARTSPGGAGTVGSAGLVREGRPPPEAVVAVMAERGIDVSAHRSRRLTPAMVAGSDVVVGMAREHVRAAVAMDLAAFPRAYTLHELVRRAIRSGPRRRDEIPLREWLPELHRGRSAAEYLRDAPDDDVPDPLGSPVGIFEALADELDRSVAVVASHVLGASRPAMIDDR